jgi:hypothetical protein
MKKTDRLEPHGWRIFPPLVRATLYKTNGLYQSILAGHRRTARQAEEPAALSLKTEYSAPAAVR